MHTATSLLPPRACRAAALAALALTPGLAPAAPAAFPNPIAQLKAMHRETPLLDQGRPAAVILVPAGAAGAEAGRVVAERLRAVDTLSSSHR